MSVSLEATVPAIVPLFPLPEHVLLPAVLTPYRIFEPRYRRMVEDLLEMPAAERLLVVPRALAARGASSGDAAPFHPIAALGQLTTATPLVGGDYLIVVLGLAPCTVREVEAPLTPYRVARVTPLRDLPATAPGAGPSDDDLIAAMGVLLAKLGRAAGDLPMPRRGRDGGPGQIAYRIAAAVVDDVDKRLAILEERCVGRRRGLVFDEIVEHLAAACLPQARRGA